MQRITWDRTLGWLAVAVIATGAFLRVVYLDADPNYYGWAGYITDEGRWVQAARSVSLHGIFPQGLGEIHFLIAPVFQAANFAIFQLLGVSILSTRVFSALCGIFILVVFWTMMRRVVTAQAALVGLALLAFQADLIALSRVAIPEIPAMLLELLVYWAVTRSKSRAHLVGAGLLTCLAIGMKVTAGYITLIAATIILFAPMSRVPFRERFRNLALYAAPLLAVISIGALVSLALIDSRALAVGMGEAIRFIRGFLVAPSGLYQFLAFPFTGGFAWTFDLWVLGLWLSLLAFLARRHTEVSPQERIQWVSSALWVGLYVPMMLGIAYFPDRYKVHVLLPIAINIASGLNMFLRLGPSRVVESLSVGMGLQGLLRRILLVSPSAVFMGLGLVQLGSLAGMDRERLANNLAAIALSAGLLTAAAQFRKTSRRMAFFLFFPFLCLAAVLLQYMVHLNTSPWPAVANPLELAGRFGLLAVIALLASMTSPLSWRATTWSGLVIGLVVVISAWLTVRAASAHAAPQYSIMNASKDLGNLFANCTKISALRGEGLFNNNSLHYQSHGGFHDGSRPDCLVVAFRPGPGIIAREYDLVKTYALFVSDEYCKKGSFVQASGCKVPVTVHVRRRAGR